MAVAALVVLVLLIPGMIWLGQAREAIGVSWVAGPVVVFGVFAGLIIRLKHPWKMKRAIELDFGADQLRVFKGQKLKISRQLSRMANLTVEDHPDAEHARITRQEHGKKSPKDVEKQHCLIGWFGAGGAEQVMLLARAEWPCRNSLFEVRQAILWAIEQARDNVTGTRGPDLSMPQTRNDQAAAGLGGRRGRVCHEG